MTCCICHNIGSDTSPQDYLDHWIKDNGTCPSCKRDLDQVIPHRGRVLRPSTESTLKNEADMRWKQDLFHALVPAPTRDGDLAGLTTFVSVPGGFCEIINPLLVKHLTEPLFFFGRQGIHGALSQWYPSRFVVDDICFENAETYMMHQKALLFHDVEVARRILASQDPAQVKRLGRTIRDFNEQTWEAHRTQIVYAGNYAKFTQNTELREVLLQTGSRPLIEASPFDRIWGIGYSAEKAEANRHKWGKNLLGQTLVEVRAAIANQ